MLIKASRINALAARSFLRTARTFMGGLRICESFIWISKRAQRNQSLARTYRKAMRSLKGHPT